MGGVIITLTRGMGKPTYRVSLTRCPVRLVTIAFTEIGFHMIPKEQKTAAMLN